MIGAHVDRMVLIHSGVEDKSCSSWTILRINLLWGALNEVDDFCFIVE